MKQEERVPIQSSSGTAEKMLSLELGLYKRWNKWQFRNLRLKQRVGVFWGFFACDIAGLTATPIIIFTHSFPKCARMYSKSFVYVFLGLHTFQIICTVKGLKLHLSTSLCNTMGSEIYPYVFSWHCLELRVFVINYFQDAHKIKTRISWGLSENFNHSNRTMFP